MHVEDRFRLLTTIDRRADDCHRSLLAYDDLELRAARCCPDRELLVPDVRVRWTGSRSPPPSRRRVRRPARCRRPCSTAIVDTGLLTFADRDRRRPVPHARRPFTDFAVGPARNRRVARRGSTGARRTNAPVVAAEIAALLGSAVYDDMDLTSAIGRSATSERRWRGPSPTARPRLGYGDGERSVAYFYGAGEWQQRERPLGEKMLAL